MWYGLPSPRRRRITQTYTSFLAEHVQRLFNQDQATTNTSIQHYKAILRNILDLPAVSAQTAKAMDNGAITTSLTPTYLCLQCPSILTEEDLSKHGNRKSHRFCMYPDRPMLWSQIRGLTTRLL